MDCGVLRCRTARGGRGVGAGGGRAGSGGSRGVWAAGAGCRGSFTGSFFWSGQGAGTGPIFGGASLVFWATRLATSRVRLGGGCGGAIVVGVGGRAVRFAIKLAADGVRDLGLEVGRLSGR